LPYTYTSKKYNAQKLKNVCKLQYYNYLNGKIYAIGGSILPTVYNDRVVNTNEQYNPKTDTWVTLEPMPTSRTYFAIAAYQDKIYCMGGGSMERGKYIGCDAVEVYDIATNSWSTKTAAPFNGSSQAQVIQGKIFAIKFSSYMENNLYMYDPVTDEWIEKASLPYIHNLVYTSAAVDDKLIVIGSFMFNQLSTDGNSLLLTNEEKIMIYDSKTDVWSETGPAKLDGRSEATGVTTGVYAPQKIYVLSSFSNYVYDLEADTWSTAEAMPTLRTGFGVAVVDDVLYVIGGRWEDTFSLTEQYVPIGYHTPIDDEGFSKYLVVTISALIVGVIVTVVFFYFKKTH
jgi:N-acetylneuraminic acid mutarotase